MIAAQGGLCCLCLRAPAVHVDHCHKTGRVRGVLCFNCNVGLGLLKESPDRIRRAAEYLEGTRGSQHS
ncbi:endonuclease VII domain-containing protein [Streptomyces virginiae]|uniref:endonuclease VII domain-containing protein n=2 Tax=Streptomyces TaxID=1883 RepID=UPI0036B99D71